MNVPFVCHVIVRISCIGKISSLLTFLTLKIKIEPRFSH